MLGLHFVGDVGQIDIAFDERWWHVAFFPRRGGTRGAAESDGQGSAGERARGEDGNNEFHASPPARSASGVLTRDVGPRPSMYLYHDIRLAVAIMIRMPARLMSAWIKG